MSGIEQQNSSTGLRFGFLGSGRMAQALASGFVKSGLVDGANIIASNPSAPNLSKMAALGAKTTHNNDDVVSACDVLMLCVKPQILRGALKQVAPPVKDEQLVISVVAGISIEQLNSLLGGKGRIIRVMPNMPCLVNCGAAAFSAGPRATPEDCTLANDLFSSVGICEQVPERLIDVVTGLSGSGPAFVFQVIESMADGAVRMGMPRRMAQQFASQTVKGAAIMVEETGKHPAELKDEICSPGGTTIAGVHQLEKTGLRAALMNGVQAATERAIELGKQQ